jgi:hypothetical protein
MVDVGTRVREGALAWGASSVPLDDLDEISA